MSAKVPPAAAEAIEPPATPGIPVTAGASPAPAAVSNQGANTRINRFNGNARTNSLPKDFTGSALDVRAAIGTREENGKESFNRLQDHILQYVMEKDEKGVDLVPLIRNLKEVTLDDKEMTPPGDDDKPATPPELKKCEMKLRRHMDRVETLKEIVTNLYFLVWGQCTDALKAELKGLDLFKDKDNNFDAKWLLEQVKLAASGIEQRTFNACKTTYKMGRQFYTFRQAEDEPFEAFLKRFLDFVSNIELAGIDVIHHPYLEELERANLTKENPIEIEEATATEAKTNTAEVFRAVIFFMATDYK